MKRRLLSGFILAAVLGLGGPVHAQNLVRTARTVGQATKLPRRALLIRQAGLLRQIPMLETAVVSPLAKGCAGGACPIPGLNLAIDEAATRAALEVGIPRPLTRPGVFATVSPNTFKTTSIEELINEGLDVARVNYSHGTPASNAETIRAIRAAGDKVGRRISVVADLQGPKVRVGRFANGEVMLIEDAPFTLTTSEVTGDATRVGIDFPQVAEYVQPGDRLLLDDGNLVVRVTANDGKEIQTVVEKGGILKDRKGVLVPERKIPLPGLTAVDEANIVHQVDAGVDAIAISFVRDAETIQRARAIAAEAGAPDMLFIAKVEDLEGIENLRAIAQEADMIMIAQGDLGVIVPEPMLTTTRAEILAINAEVGTPTIVATRLLESMSEAGAKATPLEIARIQDMQARGAQFLMLSNETASGAQPVQTLSKLIDILTN